MARKKHDTTLDRTLNNIKRAILGLSKVIADKVKDLEVEDHDLPTFARAAKDVMAMVTMLSEQIPFLQTRQQIEVTEAIKEAILDSSEIIGEKREHALEALIWYEEEVLAKTGHYTPRNQQMTML